jgi:hypothetical protein
MSIESMTRIVSNIVKIIFWVVAAGAIVFAFLLFNKSNAVGISVDAGSLESNALSAIEIGQMSESNLVALVNHYRQDVPWISASNDRIYAGIYDRNWSVDFSVDGYKNEAGLLFGTGFGAYYNRTIFGRFTIGGVLIIDAEKNFEAFGTAGYKW